jgi:hypothetical protein
MCQYANVKNVRSSRQIEKKPWALLLFLGGIPEGGCGFVPTFTPIFSFHGVGTVQGSDKY